MRILYSIFLIVVLMSSRLLNFSEISAVNPSAIPVSNKLTIAYQADNLSKEVEQLNSSLRKSLVIGDYKGSRIIINQISQKIENSEIADNTLSDSYYYIGTFYLLTSPVNEAIRYLNLCIELKEKTAEYDKQYAKALYNLGVLYARLGDYKKQMDYALRSLKIDKKYYEDTSPSLINTYCSLITAYIQLQDYEKAVDYSNIALEIGNNQPDSVSPTTMSDLYNNLGVCYTRLSDFSKANIFLDKSESIFRKEHIAINENYINLLNNLAISYGAINMPEKSHEYYERGIALAISENSYSAYNIINSYAIIMGNEGKVQKGDSLLSHALMRAGRHYGEDSRFYIEVLKNYADFLRGYMNDNKRALICYEACMDYLNRNQSDMSFRTEVLVGCSISLTHTGDPMKALETIQSLIYAEYGKTNNSEIFENPAIETIKPDRRSLRILQAKYEILWEIYKNSSDINFLKTASGTAELIVSLLEKARLNISEEDSRLILGNRYRDSYLNAIRDFNLLYSQTVDSQYLNKVFEYSEKSKVAGLLTATRELKAAQFHIPDNIAVTEKQLQRDISLLNESIAMKTANNDPDTLLVYQLKENLLNATRRRDSLITVFEKQYPDYYAIKYNTRAAGLKDMPRITDRDGNYISYVVSDTLLYIFIANRKYQQVITTAVDSIFFQNISGFRKLLSIFPSSENARMAFEQYQSLGYELYKILIDPVRKYIISDDILISPDNILSYIPFEALLTSPDSGTGMIYRTLPYLMNDLNISYTYSATFLTESVKKNYNLNNKVIAFAPDYHKPVDIQTLFLNRQADMNFLPDLPFARQEAEFVSDITGGILFINGEAKESVYKAESGKYDIIHLAMHTLLNDKDPMYSTLIFSAENDTTEDSYLKTYEVYGIPLRAKMVVLSSCNTGNGILSSGEGILSLARGFIYSGSQSVVMSMWEIEDRSGTEVIRMFYENLIKGNSKSVALKRARIRYLKRADQLRSHPYFWATLVIYGNNAPLYYSKYLIISAMIVILSLSVSVFLYVRKRKYS